MRNNKIKLIDQIKPSFKSPVLGIARISKNNKVGWVKNTTIAIGREFFLRKIFNYNGSSNINNDFNQNYFITSFGIGNGGSVYDEEGDIILKGPKTCDNGLYSPIEINASAKSWNGVKTVKDIQGNIDFKKLKDIEDEIEITSSEFEDCSNYITVAKCICEIGANEPTMPTNGTKKVDEACLFATDVTDPNNTPIPIAHLCFPPDNHTAQSNVTIEWYVLF